ncbi:TetR/AcrR family transcriptional regulator [Aeoliella sp. ICT_H6.2]|uniref:TetR/AcrR family transcriptional regulator n=1 Tax=Aeoliella straminimaris TaxID=2954799 RepID=A0A9X2FBK3_9BACT|nr:TetR/AcrR family transcriptional regulator [Aeoliella straminimaris]MCO6045228.1 TetR/AcrR family transcriptional regulator [Aeoliella straminimaris]
MKPKEAPKFTEKQAEILETAYQVFAKEGFRNTDVQVIADLAGVGKGTVYRHFGNKEELFLATAKYCLTKAGQYIEQQVLQEDDLETLRDHVGALEILRRAAVAYAKYYQNNPLTIEILIQERAEFRESVFPTHLMWRAEARERMDELFKDAIDKKLFRNVDPKRATDAFADLLYGSVVNGCLGGGKSQLVVRVENAVDIFLHGLVRHDAPSSE